MAIRDIAAERRDLLMMNTSDLTMVTDKDHPLFDDSVFAPLDEDLVVSIMNAGIKKALLIRVRGKDTKGKEIIEIVDGRHRYKAAVEANKRLKKAGEKHLVLVPCVVEKGGETDLISSMIITNEFNHERSVLDKAKKAKRLLDRGISQAEIAIDFGVHATTVGNWFSLLKCSNKVQEAVVEGFPMMAAINLCDLSEAEQNKKLKEMLEAGVTKGRAAVEAAKNAKNGRSARPSNGSTLRMRSRAFAEKFKNALRPAQNDEDDERFTIAEEVVAFMLGDNDAFKQFKEMKAIIKPLLDEKKKASAPRTKKSKPSTETIDL